MIHEAPIHQENFFVLFSFLLKKHAKGDIALDKVRSHLKYDLPFSNQLSKVYYKRQFNHFEGSWGYHDALVAVGLSGILKAKQKLGVTFNFNKQDINDFTKFSKMTMCKASEANS